MAKTAGVAPTLRMLLVVALVLPALFGTASCATESPSPRLRHAVEVVEEGLETGNLGDVRTVDGAEAAAGFATITEGMDGVLPRVRPGTISLVEAGRANVPLAFEWRFASGTWRYETTAVFVQRRLRWELEWRPELVHPSLDAGTRLVHRWTPAERGQVLGRGRLPIVRARETFTLGLDKSTVPAAQVDDSARRIAAALQVDEQRYRERVRAAGDIAFVEALTIRTEQAEVPPAFLDTPGARIHRGERQLAPTPTFAQGLLGTVVPADVARAEASGGTVREGEPVGVGGLQERYDRQLRGVPGDRVIVAPVDVPAGTLEDPPVLFDAPPTAGAALETTLDMAAQRRAEEVLADVPGPAALVALEASTGAILAAATSPSVGAEPIATYGRYPPGPAFGAIGTLALVRAGLVPDSPVTCAPTLTVEGRTLTGTVPEAVGASPTTLGAAAADGCTTALASQHEALGPDQLGDAAASLGLGRDHDAGFPAFYGTVPPTDGGLAAAEALMGAGTVEVSPLAMAGVAASVAAGRTMVPYLLEQQPAPDAAPLTAEEATALRTVMQQAVRDGAARSLAGVLTGALGGTIPGDTAATGGPSPAGDEWMIGYRDDLAVAVFVRDAAPGTAARLLHDQLLHDHGS